MTSYCNQEIFDVNEILIRSLFLKLLLKVFVCSALVCGFLRKNIWDWLLNLTKKIVFCLCVRGSMTLKSCCPDSQATFTLQALFLNLDLLLKSDIFCLAVLKCVQYEIPVWTGHRPELTCIHKRTITKTSHAAGCRKEVNMKATEVSVYGFKLMCAGSQQISEQMITRMSMRRKRAKFLTMFFLCSNGCCFCKEMCVDAESEAGVVESWHEWLHRNRFYPNFQDVKGYF